MDQIEIRQAGELRADENGGKLIGYAAVFNSRSSDLGGFVEVITPGAFKGSVGGDIRALWNHDSNIVLGRTAAGTLAITEDERGLLVEITPPDTNTARDLMESVKRGDVSQMSFSFSVNPGGQVWAEEGDLMLRTLTDVTLHEVSPVAFPAYTDTSIAARALEHHKAQVKPPRRQASTRARMRLGLHDRGYFF